MPKPTAPHSRTEPYTFRSRLSMVTIVFSARGTADENRNMKNSTRAASAGKVVAPESSRAGTTVASNMPGSRIWCRLKRSARPLQNGAANRVMTVGRAASTPICWLVMPTLW